MLERIGIVLAIAVLGACGGSAVTPVVPGVRGGDIAWDANRRLSWSDFRGRVDPRATAERVAMTAASLSWGYEFQLERDEVSCGYRITRVRTEAIFNQDESWVRPGHQIASVLDHEQGHFDLTQVYKTVLDGRASHLIGRARGCEGGSLEAASRFTERDAAALMSGLFNEVWEEYLATQAAYDRHTRNGTAAETQQRWTESIARSLRSGRWLPPADAAG
ncbi:MAG TPA: hypothetical protein VLD39_00560 [Gammaproteobacteria bacterium]|nr:hypothetical protein [Gammaproteobacteria bacterium]